jgi:hypothetical protein
MKTEFSISAKAKNLFFSLSESIAQTLNGTLCCFWGGPTWETIGLEKNMINGLACNDGIKIQTSKLDDAL